MSDTISRQAAIDKAVPLNLFGREVMMVSVSELENLPSVTPERKTGKWINGYCSDCGKHAPFWAMASTYYKSSFCPNCGARMDKEESKC